MGLGLKERIELMRQGIIHRYIVPSLEMRGFIVAEWKRPVSLEDMILRDEGWIPQYTPYTTWETYKRDAPLYLYFNTFYGDVYERAYRHCFVEYIINLHNYPLPPKLLGIFTRLNVENGYYWKHRVAIDLTYPDNAVTEIDSKYDELTLLLSREGIVEAGESESQEDDEEK